MDEMFCAATLTRTSGNLNGHPGHPARALGLVTAAPPTTSRAGNGGAGPALARSADGSFGGNRRWRFAMLVPRPALSAGTFSSICFVSDGERYVYRLVHPAGASTGQPLPVMVMLLAASRTAKTLRAEPA